MPPSAGLSLVRNLWSCQVLALSLLAAPAVAQNVVRINGTGSGTGGMQLLATTFMKAQPGIEAQVGRAMGSTGGISALIAGQIDIALSNRPPREAEQTLSPMRVVEYARTPFVVAVHKSLGITSMSLAELAAVLVDPGSGFSNGQRARAILRAADAEDTVLLKSFSPEIAAAVDVASKRRGMIFGSTDSDAADLIEHTPGGYGVSTLSLIESEKRPLVALALDGRWPSVAALIDGRYPYFKRLYAITRLNPSAATRKFMDFLRSAEGQTLLRANGHWPQ